MNLENSVWKLFEELSRKSGISEIIINNENNIYVEREGELIRLNVSLNAADIKAFIVDVAKFNDLPFDVEHPILDGSLHDGSRINIIDGSFSGGSPAITIRKFLKTIKSFSESPGIFSLSPKIVEFLKMLVVSKQNIIVSGGTGTGKTTLMNLMLQELPVHERVITIEDTRELVIKIPNSVRLLTKTHLVQGRATLTTRDLLKNTLRMRPDRIIIGEVRGGEAFDLLQAMNTGHDGSMCTIHANNPFEALSRLENLFLFAGFDVPLKAVRMQMASAIDFIIQLEKTRDGKRIISKISEVTGMEGDRVLLSDLISQKDGIPEFTRLVPTRIKTFMEYGMKSDFFF